MTSQDINQGIAEFFRKARLKRHLSKLKMADLLYMDDKTWGRYESGASSPSVGEFIRICNDLGESALKPVLELIYPTVYKTDCGDVAELRKAASHYFLSVASDQAVRQWEFLCFGEHGSNIEPQLQEFCMIDHLPLEYRVLIARMVRSCWDMAVSRGDIICTDAIMPDIDLLDYGISQGQMASAEHHEGYTTIMGGVVHESNM